MHELPQIDRVLKAAIDRGDVPGVVAMAGGREGPVYQGAFGKRALPDGAAMTPDTVFWIASMTKAVTSTAAMQLVEQGRLSLDQPIANVLPELAAPQVLEGFDAAGEPRLRPAARPITLRHLLTHTAGFVLRHLEPGSGPVHRAQRHPQHLHVPRCGADAAAGLRSGPELGIRHQHRLDRQGGRAGERPAARRLLRRASVRADRHEGHRLQADPGAARPAGRHAFARRRRRARADGSSRCRRSRNSRWAAAAFTAPRPITLRSRASF